MADENRPQIARDPELERARAWWQAHGRSIVAGLVIGLAAVVGFNYWQDYQETQAENASVLFERLHEVITSAAEAEVETDTGSETAEDETNAAEADQTNDETNNESETETAVVDDADDESETESESETNPAASIHRIADELMSEYGATPYAAHGAFALAKFSVDNGNLDRAAEALQWIVDNGDDVVLHIARLRLAAVWLSLGKADSVVTLLDVADTAGFAARYHERVGDARLQTGDIAGARSAYQDSMTALEPDADEHALLKLKLDDLGE